MPSVETLTADHFKAIVAAFEYAHEVLYHYRMEGYPAEFVSCRVEAVGRVDTVTPEELPVAGPDPSAAAKGTRLAYLPDDGRFEPVETFDGERLEPGNRIAGTAIVETEGSTLVVWKDQRLTVNRYGDFEIDIGA